MDRFIDEALAEDVGPGDYTTLSTVSPQAAGMATLLAKDHGVIAGVELAQKIYHRVASSSDMEIKIPDGTTVIPGDVVFTVKGNLRLILTTERLVLNCMQRMSGIATLTRKVTDTLKGLHTKVLDTRKTTPGFRAFEKWAVRIGGGCNHRFGLYDMILIKDNHSDAAGGVEKALALATAYLRASSQSLKIEVETRNLDEIGRVLKQGGADRILLDNFDPDELRKAVTFIRGKAETEASGKITPENARTYAETGVDYISMGSLTHSYTSLDLSLKIRT